MLHADGGELHEALQPPCFSRSWADPGIPIVDLVILARAESSIGVLTCLPTALEGFVLDLIESHVGIYESLTRWLLKRQRGSRLEANPWQDQGLPRGKRSRWLGNAAISANTIPEPAADEVGLIRVRHNHTCA